MARLIHDESGKVRWEGDDPKALYEVLLELGDEAGEYVIEGFDVTELPDEPVDE